MKLFRFFACEELLFCRSLRSQMVFKQEIRFMKTPVVFKPSVSKGGKSPSTAPPVNAFEAFSRASDATTSTVSAKAEKISKAMKAYLQRANAHEAFMSHEVAEFEIGKRHLANIMSLDPDTISQEEIDKAIEYLLPSGLFHKGARPKLKHPIDVIPKRKAAQFGIDGRPFHFLFFTGAPNYYQVMHEASWKIDELNIHEDNELKLGKKAQTADKLQISNSQWFDQKTLEAKFQEKLSEADYQRFIKLFERLSDHPYSSLAKDLVLAHRKLLPMQSLQLDIPPLKVDESGRPYMEAEGARRDARATVVVRGNGSGLFTINGKDLLDFFPSILNREEIMFPIQFVEKLGEIDVECQVAEGLGGPTGQAGAIRLAVSLALQSFVERTTVDKMRIAGLLTRDPRRRERKKPGQEGARRKYTWRKR